MYQICRRLDFDAAHRVVGHEGKCRHLHGHRYGVEVFAQGDLDQIGRVIDFGSMKTLIGGWIDEHWDHNALLNPHDPMVLELGGEDMDRLFGRRPYLMGSYLDPISWPDRNPTAENIAAELFYSLRMGKVIIGSQCNWLRKIRVWETPNCYAEFQED